MRTKIFISTKNPAGNYVTVQRNDPFFDGEILETEYFAPAYGGYVKINDGKNFPQICDGLARLGNTLIWSGKSPFIDLIRREYRAGMRSDKRAMAGS